MKTIGIVTFFKSYNYGVWLQAIATQNFLKNAGFNVQIINYTNPEEDKKIRMAYRENGRIIGYVTSFLKSLIFGKVKYYRKGFANHIHDYYSLTEKHYTCIDEMVNVKYDVLLAGSDQLWNPETTGGKLEKVFLLCFGQARRKISYATSIGSTPIRKSDEQIFKEAFKTFDAVSVRETYASEQLQSLCGVPIKTVLDPTFLLEKQDWMKLSQKFRMLSVPKCKYILTYFISEDKRSERYRQIVNAYSNMLQVPVFAIQFSRAKSTPFNRLILGGSPSDFIALLNQSMLFITDSFHGVALSVNLNKEFVAVENMSNPQRVRHLLNNIELESRIGLKPEEYYTIDYRLINEKVKLLREASRDWLLDAIN